MAEITDFHSSHTDSEFEEGITKALRLPDTMGASGQVLKSTGMGTEWGDASGGPSAAVDPTLSIPGAAADAAATGAAISDVNRRIDDLPTGGGNGSSGSISYITPEMYGAVGDGVTDDTAALAEMFSSAISSKKNIYIPDGTYIFDKLEFPSAYQQGLIISGSGKFRATLKAKTSTSQIKFGSNLRYDISQIGVIGEINSTTPVIDMEGLSHHSSMTNCYLKATTGVYVDSSAYMVFRDSIFAVHKDQTTPSPYLLSLNGEYAYVQNCYFSGKNSIADVGLKIGHCSQVYIDNCDPSGFKGGTGLLINPAGGGAYNVHINNTTLFYNKKCMDIVLSGPIQNITLSNLEIYDGGNYTEQIIGISRPSGSSAVIESVNGNITVRGNPKSGVDDFFPITGSIHGQSKIVLESYSGTFIGYGRNFPIVPRLTRYGTVSSGDIGPTATNASEKRVVLSTKSPFYNHNMPDVRFNYLAGNKPVSYEIFNEYGGEFGFVLKYASIIANLYTKGNYRLVEV